MAKDTQGSLETGLGSRAGVRCDGHIPVAVFSGMEIVRGSLQGLEDDDYMVYHAAVCSSEMIGRSLSDSGTICAL